jgi:hypothetical protein
MPSQPKVLGILTPVGGGDPIPLRKAEIVVGRRGSCDVCLDFANVSGKHCKLRFQNHAWHIRDLGSTNGTTVNGAPIMSEHTVMPDDEVGIASHLFTIDYEPGGPGAVVGHQNILDEDIVEVKKRHSLLELAGINTDEDRARPPGRHGPKRVEIGADEDAEQEESVPEDEGDFGDSLPEEVRKAGKPAVQISDEDFFKIIEENLQKPEP